MNVQDVSWVRHLGRTGGARVIREGAGFSASEIARQLGVSPAAVSRWERGERVPRGEVAEQWAHLLRRLVELPP
jgi:transcriptional regulator with XRE-family HTH domain